jgi:hydroxyethylthiazole kinase
LETLAQTLAVRRKATVVITGETDIVADAKGIYRVKNGHILMTRVVGTGCMAASVIGAFAAVEPDHRKAAACALACYEIAAELAAKKARGPASFKAALFDCLYNLDRPTVEKMQRVEA